MTHTHIFGFQAVRAKEQHTPLMAHPFATGARQREAKTQQNAGTQASGRQPHQNNLDLTYID